MTFIFKPTQYTILLIPILLFFFPSSVLACGQFQFNQKIIDQNEKKIEQSKDVLAFSGIVKSIVAENLRQKITFLVDQAWYNVVSSEVTIETPLSVYEKSYTENVSYGITAVDSCGTSEFIYELGNYYTVVYNDALDTRYIMESGYNPTDFKKVPKDFLPTVSKSDFNIRNRETQELYDNFDISRDKISPWTELEKLTQEKYDLENQKSLKDNFDPMDYKYYKSIDITAQNIEQFRVGKNNQVEIIDNLPIEIQTIQNNQTQKRDPILPNQIYLLAISIIFTIVLGISLVWYFRIKKKSKIKVE